MVKNIGSLCAMLVVAGCATNASVRNMEISHQEERRVGSNALLPGGAFSDERQAQIALEYIRNGEHTWSDGSTKIILPEKHWERDPSGRWCREFIVARNDRQMKKYACRVAEERWEPAERVPPQAHATPLPTPPIIPEEKETPPAREELLEEERRRKAAAAAMLEEKRRRAVEARKPDPLDRIKLLGIVRGDEK